jgi:hypothetical protein
MAIHLLFKDSVKGTNLCSMYDKPIPDNGDQISLDCDDIKFTGFVKSKSYDYFTDPSNFTVVTIMVEGDWN